MSVAGMLTGRVALVTGASRGIGRGIAVQLGAAGATVYVTGRRADAREPYAAKLKLQTVDATANEVTARGGKGIAVYCNHADMTEVQQLFEKIDTEQNGRLDILVNNAYGAVNTINRNAEKSFWQLDPSIWDEVNVVGLKNHYHCSVHAARMMTNRKSGLIITVSSLGGIRYLFNTAYATGKAACDKLASDMAQELFSSNVASVALWPGAVKTEIVQRTLLNNKEYINNSDNEQGKRAVAMFEVGETVELSGRCVVALATDEQLMAKSGRILETAELARDYGLTDIDGTIPTPFGDSEVTARYLSVINEIRKPSSKM